MLATAIPVYSHLKTRLLAIGPAKLLIRKAKCGPEIRNLVQKLNLFVVENAILWISRACSMASEAVAETQKEMRNRAKRRDKSWLSATGRG